jgi:glycosyltransferase involved in cell wall biosynthesis
MAENVTIHSLNIVQSHSRLVRNTTGMIKTIKALHKTVRQVKPDVFVSFLDSVGCVYVPIGSALTKSKFVVSERVDPYSYGGKKAKVRFSFIKKADGVVFQTAGAQEFFKDYKKIYDHSTVIPNPVVLGENVMAMQKMIPDFLEREKKIVTLGRLSLTQKRQDVLLDAFKIFHQGFPDYQLVIYGEGEHRAQIQKMIEDRNLTDSVFLAGRTEHAEEAIFHAAAFVLSSDFEGIPNALIEAMSIGVPSVSTDCSPGGAALLIRDGENGFLVPRGDAKAIAEKLSVLVDDAEIATRFSRNSLLIAEEFSEEIIADKWETFFKNIVNDEGIEV